MASIFEVRVSRLFLLTVFLMGAIFVWFGGWLVFALGEAGTEVYGDLVVETQVSENARWLGLIPLGIGLLVVIRQGLYLLKPPLMLAISEKGVTFGTGFGYKPYTVPLEFVESATDLKGSLVIKFKESEKVPMALVTSAGIHYALYLLSLNRLYMNTAPKRAIEALKALGGL
jgi:hypothetical protein